MKAQTFDLNSLINLGNQIFGLFPKLMSLVYFVVLVVLVWRILRQWRALHGISTIELAAVAIACALAGGR
jgi:hypothetical protein